MRPHGVQTAVGVLGLTQGGQRGGMQAGGCGGVDFGYQLTRSYIVAVFYVDFGQGAAQREYKVYFMLRPDVAYVVAFGGGVAVADGKDLYKYRVGPTRRIFAFACTSP